MRQKLPRFEWNVCDRHAISRRRAIWWAIASSAGSMLLAYMFDPQLGRRRRNMLRDRSTSRSRKALRAIASVWRKSTADAYGMSHKIVHLVPRTTDIVDDETLCQRVESQLFRDRHIAKGNLNISAEHGTLILRGEVHTPDEITRVEDRVRQVPGVGNIQNLLHVEGTPAPNKERSRMAL